MGFFGLTTKAKTTSFSGLLSLLGLSGLSSLSGYLVHGVYWVHWVHGVHGVVGLTATIKNYKTSGSLGLLGLSGLLSYRVRWVDSKKLPQFMEFVGFSVPLVYRIFKFYSARNFVKILTQTVELDLLLKVNLFLARFC